MTNFTNTTNMKGAYMSDREHTAKSTSPRTGLFATLSHQLHGPGTSAPSRLRATLATLALAIAAFALTAAPASAAPPTVGTTIVSEVGYTSAKVTGEVTSDGSEGFSEYEFQYSSDGGATWSPGPRGALAESPSPQTFESTLQGLKPATHYNVRLGVDTHCVFGCEGPFYSGPEAEFTTLPVEPPTVTVTDDASEVFSITAKASGRVKRPANPDPAFDVNCHFEYISDAQYEANELASAPLYEGATQEACAQNPITKDSVDLNGEALVTAQIPGLSPNTTYHLRLVAKNASPIAATKDATDTFTTPTVAAPTVTAIDDASEVKFNSAEFTGKVQRPAGTDPGLDTNCHFEYVTQAQFEAEEFAAAAPNGQIAGCEQNPITADKVDVSGEIEVSAKAGLFPETTYHFRLVAENEGGSDAKVAAATFTTPEAELPTVTIDPVEGGTFTTAHVTGTATLTDGHTSGSAPWLQVSSDGGATWSSYVMHWSHNGGPKSTGERPMEVGEGLYISEGDLTGLQPSTTYLFRIAASYNVRFTNNGGDGIELPESRGEVAHSPLPNPSITTEPPQPPPTASCDPITAFTATTAHFSCTVNPNAPVGTLNPAAKKAFETKWHFECAPECKDANGNEIGGTVQGEGGAQTVAGDAKRLEPGNHYEVSLIVSNEGGGETVAATFDTLKLPPTVKQTSGASDGTGGYTLQGVVNPNNETITACEFKWGPNAPAYAFSAPCSPLPSPGAKPTTVEAHLTGLNPDVDYHALLVVEYGAGLKADSGEDQIFKATLAAKESCPNEQIRKENNSLALPECRAYEMVTPPGKEGFGGEFIDFNGGDGVAYKSSAGNLLKSGQNQLGGNHYVALRSEAGWETIPNLNGSSGSFLDAPTYGSAGSQPRAYSPDLRSSIWTARRKPDGPKFNFYLRNSDGTFTLIGPAYYVGFGDAQLALGAYSADLTHLVVWAAPVAGFTLWGPGVYEYVGTGVEEPRRVDLDNSGSPASSCIGLGGGNGSDSLGNATGHSISADGRVIFITVFGTLSAIPGTCGAGDSPADEIWARLDGTVSVNASASQCNRTAPADPCNAPSNATFEGASATGSRVFFTTKQQLVNADIDQTDDLYACDIPAGTPAPIGKANPCPALTQVSGAQTGANVESVLATSDNGSTSYFTAKGVLADNKDAFGEEAVAGDHNLYAWRTDAAHPAGQTSFVARLDSDDLSSRPLQTTPDGRYLVFTTTNQLLDTDTDSARDVYRYDADTGELTRASTNVFGVAGNGDGFNVEISKDAVSDDGQKIVFHTDEALSAADGNGALDAYLWTPARVSLISTGAVGAGGQFPSVSASGQDIYFGTGGALTPADGDDAGDIYDARIGGGFSFAQAAPCSGEACQPVATPAPAKVAPGSAQPGPGKPPQPKPCPKGKVKKHGKCVKKPKKHSGKKHHGKKASHKQGGGK
jgi:hypothetical protein